MSATLAPAVFLIGTLLILRLSWRSLRHPRSHGFFRFFAFEAIFCVIVLNASHWFRHPFAPLQLLSWCLLVLSLLLAIHAAYLLRRFGGVTALAPGSPLFSFENTSSLVTLGAYRYIRHPAYTSLLCLAWGAALKSLTNLPVVLTVVATVALLATARSEERENIARFGDAYRDYMARTRLFIPFVL